MALHVHVSPADGRLRSLAEAMPLIVFLVDIEEPEYDDRQHTPAVSERAA